LRVGSMAAQLAEALGCEPDFVAHLRLTARLHDLGKIGMPDSILLKPARLTGAEFEVMKRHTVIGAGILAGGKSALMRMAQTIAISHHERWDGQGYPRGLQGEDIPLVGRIVAVADTFDALTHSRPYKDAWSKQAAAAEILAHSGKMFDPAIVQVFLNVLAYGERAGA